MVQLYKDPYLDDVAEEQGFLFEEVVIREIDLIDFITKYMESDYKNKIDNRNAWYANQLYDEQLEYFLKRYDFTKPRILYDPVLAEWVGEFLAYLQAYKKIPSRDLIKKLPPLQIYNISNVLHDLDMDLAVERVGNTL